MVDHVGANILEMLPRKTEKKKIVFAHVDRASDTLLGFDWLC